MNELERKELELLDEVEGQPEAEERFKITDLETANWAFRKISAYQKRIKEKEDLAKSEIERIESWLESETESDKQSIDYFEHLLIEYYEEERQKDKKFKLSTPYGKLNSRKRQPKVTVKDDEKAIDYLVLKNPKAVQTIRKYNKTDFKKMFDVIEVDGQLKAVDKDGEVLDFVELEAQTDSYTIKTEG